MAKKSDNNKIQTAPSDDTKGSKAHIQQADPIESASNQDNISDAISETESATDVKDLKEIKQEEIRSGQTVIVNYRISEGDKTRIQPFEGIVLSVKGVGVSKTITVRKIGAQSIGVERIFPLYSPNIDSIKVKSYAKVRRAKLYYMRKRIGKAAKKIKSD